MTIIEHIYKLYRKVKDLGKKICCLEDRVEVLEAAPPTEPEALVRSIRTVTSDDEVLETDYTLLVDTSGGNVTIDIDPSALPEGTVVNIKKLSALNDMIINMVTGNIYIQSPDTSYTTSNDGQCIILHLDGTDAYGLSQN